MPSEILFSDEESFYRVLDFIPIPMLVSELIGRDEAGHDIIVHRYLNRKYLEVVGYTLEDIPDIATWFQLAYPDPEYREVVIREWEQAGYEALAAGKTTISYKAKILCKDRTARWVEIIAEVNSTIKKNLHVVAFIEFTQLYETMTKMEKLTKTDLLTDILNRRGLIVHLEQECIRVKRTERSFCLALCDIDNFKQVNDMFGHDCGDHIIVQVANIIKFSIRETDFVARWGGEEFCLLMPETDLLGAEILINRIRDHFATTDFSWHGLSIAVTLTFGIAWHDIENSLDETLKQADIALYRGKAQGKDCIMIYQEDN